jgi:hypothetical protein
MEWLILQKVKQLPLNPHKTSNVRSANQKPFQKWFGRNNGHAIYVKIVFLKPIWSHINKLHEKKNTCHYIWKKELPHQLQMGLEKEWIKNNDIYLFQ